MSRRPIVLVMLVGILTAGRSSSPYGQVGEQFTPPEGFVPPTAALPPLLP